MLVEIASLQDDERGCYASNAHFAEFFGLSVSRVSEIISGLADKGLVTVEQVRDGKRIVERQIRMIGVFGKPDTPSEKAANPFGKGGEPPSENTKGSNTRESNTKTNTLTVAEQAFEAAWKAYPKREGANPKNKALSCFKARLAEGEKLEDILAGIARYAGYCQAKGMIGSSYVMQAARFFGTERAYANEWTAGPVKGGNGKPQQRHHGFGDLNYGDATEVVGGF